MEENKISCLNPDCRSTQIRISGSYAKGKPEGAESSKGPSKTLYYCHDCGKEWETEI